MSRLNHGMWGVGSVPMFGFVPLLGTSRFHYPSTCTCNGRLWRRWTTLKASKRGHGVAAWRHNCKPQGHPPNFFCFGWGGESRTPVRSIMLSVLEMFALVSYPSDNLCFRVCWVSPGQEVNKSIHLQLSLCVYKPSFSDHHWISEGERSPIASGARSLKGQSTQIEYWRPESLTSFLKPISTLHPES